MRSTQEVARLFLNTPRSERRKRFILVREAAEIIGMNRRTIQRWVERGDLEAARIGNRLWIVRASLHEQVSEANQD